MENPVKKLNENDPVPEKTVSKVISGTGKTRKKSILEKFAGMIISSDIESVKETVMAEVVIPTIKNLIADAVSNGINTALFGESGARSKKSSYVSYDTYYGRKSSETRPRAKAGYEYDDIIVDSRGEAEMILSSMSDLIDRYKVASIADLYDLAGLPSRYTDNKYGWTDVYRAEIVHTRDGYLIKMPKAYPLD